MHIPDGYLSPETCAMGAAVMVPAWATAGRKVRTVADSRSVPLLAVSAAFAFLLMMFNVPIPDGTTAHAVGAVLIAVILGPWAAVVAVSTALAIQALFFGDGGVLAYGVNCFNMAFVMPMVGYFGVYKPLTRRVSLTSPRRAFAAAVGGYVGLSTAALCAGVELGLQPDLFHTAAGQPLYAPYHLAQAVPAMLLAHLTVAGGVEFAVTFGVVSYLQRANLPIMAINHDAVPETDAELAKAPAVLRWYHALVPLVLLALATPLGLLAHGDAYGEADPKADPNGFLQRNHLSAIPAGLDRYTGFWHHALFNGYDISHDRHPALGYIASALFGLAVIALVIVAVGTAVRLVARRWASDPDTGAGEDVAPAPATVRAERSSLAPDWLTRSEVGMCPCGCIGRRKKGNFVEQTLAGAANVMRRALFGDEVASREGLLQSIDARVKVVTVVAVLVAAALVRSTTVLLGLYALTLLVAAASHVELRTFLKRVWLFVPIFTGIVVLPATLNVITKGPIVVPLGHWWFGHRIGVTSTGLRAAALIVSRVAVSVSLVVLLTLTTPWAKLLAALRALFVPRLFIQVLGMAYRYVFSLLTAVDDMYTARKSRMVGAETDVRAGRAFVAASGGALLGRAQSLSEEVHLAMVSRGYVGEARTLDSFRIAANGVLWIGGSVITVALVIGVDRALTR